MKRRFLVIGCGSIGRRHIKNLLLLGAGDVFVYDVRVDRVQQMEGVIPVHTLEDGWKKNPEVVLITVPTSLHLDLAMKAAEKRCHLFIEKPVSNQREGLDALVDKVRDSGVVTLVGCNMRFHPALQRVKTLLSQQAIGRIVAARLEVGHYLPDWHPQEDYQKGYSAQRSLGGGVLLDAIHELDYARWLFGDVKEVCCLSEKLSSLAIDTEDTAAILLRFSCGMIAEVHMDYVQRSYSRSLHVIGEDGTIRWEWGGEVRVYTALSRKWKIFAPPDSWDLNQMYVDEMRHFLRCLEGEENSEQDVSSAAEVLDIALAAKASSDTRRFISLGAK